jgi:uncharacterized membrane protein
MSSRTLKVALIASLVLNLFLIGAGISAGIMLRQTLRDRTLATPLFVAARTLDPQTQARLRDHMRANALKAAPDFMEAREARRKAAALAAAPNFDQNAVMAELERADKAADRGRDKLQGAVLSFMKDLPAADRATLAPALKGRDPWRRSRKAGAKPAAPAKPS